MRWTLAKKLVLSFGLVLAVTIGAVAIAYVRLQQAAELQTFFISVRMPGFRALDQPRALRSWITMILRS